MDIYIKPAEKVQLVGKREVLLRDVAEVFLSGQTAGEAERLVVFRIPEERKKTYLLSVVDLIQVLHRKYPNAAVNNVGETDILIEYLPQAEGRNPLWVWAKVAFVSLVLFVGASTTIMCFHSDTQLPLIFENMYYLFFEESKEVPKLLSIPYSIGLGLGIIVFFNHFSKITLTQDPTPIEIEMTTYEKETNASVIDHLNRRKGAHDAENDLSDIFGADLRLHGSGRHICLYRCHRHCARAWQSGRKRSGLSASMRMPLCLGESGGQRQCLSGIVCPPCRCFRAAMRSARGFSWGCLQWH